METSKKKESNKKTVPEILRAGAATYEERSKVYGDNYKQFSHVMRGLFPNGIQIAPDDSAALNRIGIVVMCASKLSRYCQNISKGHVDSAHDLCVYAAMLEEITREPEASKPA